MSENIRNIAIAIAVLVMAGTYAFTTISSSNRTDRYYDSLDSNRYECLNEGDNAKQEYGYNLCMRYRGYDFGYNR